MPSQTDFDQGGTNRVFSTLWLGPSAGAALVPASVLPIVAAGTFTLLRGINLVQVNVNGSVTVILPTAIFPPSAGVGAQPALFASQAITVVDVGGFAGANPIVIKPASVAEKIMGLTQVSITDNYGAFTLEPNSAVGGWNNLVAP
jgi:hypothetical protein